MYLCGYNVLDDAERPTAVGNVRHDREHAGGRNGAFGFRDNYQNAGTAQENDPRSMRPQGATTRDRLGATRDRALERLPDLCALLLGRGGRSFGLHLKAHNFWMRVGILDALGMAGKRIGRNARSFEPAKLGCFVRVTQNASCRHKQEIEYEGL